MIITTPTIELSDWTKAYHWAKNSDKVTWKEIDGINEYYCPAGEKEALQEEEICRVVKRKWNTMGQFTRRAFSVWIVRVPENWLDSNCTCASFQKQFKCKHVIGLAIRTKKVKPPPAAKQVPLGQKRKRGRPAKSKKALLIQ